MANLPESDNFDANIYQLETTDPVQGGASGVSNSQGKGFANRTRWLKNRVDTLLDALANLLAPLNSPVFTGSPTAPTPALGDKSTTIATTAFVQGTISGILNKSVAGGSNVTLTSIEYGNGIYVFTGTLTANIAVIIPSAGKSVIVDNRTSGAFTLTLKTAAGTGVTVAQGKKRELICDGTNVLESTNDFTDAALLGAPTTTTPTTGDDSTRVASTALVRTMIDGIVTVSVAGSSNVTLTAAQADTGIVKLTGAITANINLVIPGKSGQCIIDNKSTGAFNITCKTAAGAGVILPQGLAVVVYCDGVDVFLASSAGQTSFRTLPFAPAAGTTTLNVLGGYTPGNILVEKNGSMLEPDDYTATNGTTITVVATVTGDTFTVYAFNSFSVANAVQKSGDTMSGALGLFAGSTMPTPAQFDADTEIATTAFVQRALGNFSGVVTPSAAVTMNVSQAGSLVALSNGATNDYIVTLPAASLILSSGAGYFFENVNTGVKTIAVSGGDFIYAGITGPLTSVTLAPGDTLHIVRHPTAGRWQIVGGSAMLRYATGDFGSLLAPAGWQKLPSGLIIQWGTCAYTGGSGSATFPINFPTACYSVTLGSTDTVPGPKPVISATSVSGISIADSDTTNNVTNFMAIGR